MVAGAGIPGLSLALALKRAHGPALAVTVCDPALASGAARHRGRAFAVAAGGRRMFAQLGIWEAVSAAAEPILRGGGPGDYFKISDEQKFVMMRPR